MMVNGVQQTNPYGAGPGTGQGRPLEPGVAAKMAAQPWAQSGLGAQGYFNSLNPQQQYDALNTGGKGNLHGALLDSGMSGDQINQFINYAAYHGGDIGQLDQQSPGTTFDSFGGAVNTGTGLQRGAKFGPSMNSAFNAAQQLGGQPPFGSPGGFGPPPPSSGFGGSFSAGNVNTPNGGSFNPYAPVQGGNALPSWAQQSGQNQDPSSNYGIGITDGSPNMFNSANVALQQMMPPLQAQQAYPQQVPQTMGPAQTAQPQMSPKQMGMANFNGVRAR